MEVRFSLRRTSLIEREMFIHVCANPKSHEVYVRNAARSGQLCVITACVFWSERLGGGDLDEMGFLRISFSFFIVKKAVFGSVQTH